MGSVYLHFTSRYALLGTLIQQEIQVCAPAWVNAIETAPDGNTIGGMWRCAMRLHRYADAVMWAIPRRDPQMFGDYLRKSGKLLAVQRSGASNRVFGDAMLVVGAAQFDRRWLQCSRSSSRERERRAQMRQMDLRALCDARRLDRPYGRCRLDNAFRERACCAPGNRNRIAARRCCREEAEPPCGAGIAGTRTIIANGTLLGQRREGHAGNPLPLESEAMIKSRSPISGSRPSVHLRSVLETIAENAIDGELERTGIARRDAIAIAVLRSRVATCINGKTAAGKSAINHRAAAVEHDDRHQFTVVHAEDLEVGDGRGARQHEVAAAVACPHEIARRDGRRRTQ